MGHPAGMRPHILGHIGTAYHMWVRVLATSQVSRPPTGTRRDTSGGLPSVHTAFHLQYNHRDMSRPPRPHLHSLGHAFALPVMCPHCLPCVDTTYHASTPPTTCRHRQPGIPTASHAFQPPWYVGQWPDNGRACCSAIVPCPMTCCAVQHASTAPSSAPALTPTTLLALVLAHLAHVNLGERGFSEIISVINACNASSGACFLWLWKK